MPACAGLLALGRRIPPSTTAKLVFSVAVIAATAADVALFRLTGSAGPVTSWLVADAMPVRTSTAAAFALPIGVLSVHPPDGVRYLSDACGGAACTVDSGGAAFPLHVVWVGSAMPAAYRANIRYLALQHRHRPRAAVLVWANELADLLGSPELNDLPRLGGINGPYVVRYNAGAMLSAEAAGADLLARLSDATRRPAPLAVHWSDALRLAILWRFGGAYVDVDMVPMRRLDTPEYQNSFAINDHTYRCVEPFQLPGLVVRPDTRSRDGGSDGVALVHCLCNCLAVFDRSHPLLHRALAAALPTYERDATVPGRAYAALGAFLWLDALRAAPLAEQATLRPRWNHEMLCDGLAGRLGAPTRADDVQHALAACTVVHMYGGGSSGAVAAVKGGTLLADLHMRLECALAPDSTACEPPANASRRALGSVALPSIRAIK